MPEPQGSLPARLIALDFAGLALLGLELAMPFAPDSALAQALPAAFGCRF